MRFVPRRPQIHLQLDGAAQLPRRTPANSGHLVCLHPRARVQCNNPVSGRNTAYVIHVIVEVYDDYPVSGRNVAFVIHVIVDVYENYPVPDLAKPR